MNEIADAHTRVSDKIRALHAAGYGKAEIARFLRRSYAQVHGVIAADALRRERLEGGAEEAAPAAPGPSSKSDFSRRSGPGAEEAAAGRDRERLRDAATPENDARQTGIQTSGLAVPPKIWDTSTISDPGTAADPSTTPAALTSAAGLQGRLPEPSPDEPARRAAPSGAAPFALDLDPHGAVALPPAVHEALGWRPGDRLIAQVIGTELRLLSQAEALRRARLLVRTYVRTDGRTSEQSRSGGRAGGAPAAPGEAGPAFKSEPGSPSSGGRRG